MHYTYNVTSRGEPFLGSKIAPKNSCSLESKKIRGFGSNKPPQSGKDMVTKPLQGGSVVGAGLEWKHKNIFDLCSNPDEMLKKYSYFTLNCVSLCWPDPITYLLYTESLTYLHINTNMWITCLKINLKNWRWMSTSTSAGIVHYCNLTLL